jgi:SAM-dependent methyltransferase
MRSPRAPVAAPREPRGRPASIHLDDMRALARSKSAAPSGDRRAWDKLASRPDPAWYLDPEAALQKRRVHQDLIRKWVGTRPAGLILKTDLFEEAWGADRIFFDLFEPGTAALLGMDIAYAAAGAARASAAPGQPLAVFVSDVRLLPIASDSLDLVLSLSTLDHFDSQAEFEHALGELCEALKPGGRLIVTMDNPLNPLYPLLRLATRAGLAPFPLGYTATAENVMRNLRRKGFEIFDHDWLIHNPRIVSTALFLLLRRLCGRRADEPIRWLLSLFAVPALFWTRRFTACFYAIYAGKKCS